MYKENLVNGVTVIKKIKNKYGLVSINISNGVQTTSHYDKISKNKTDKFKHDFYFLVIKSGNSQTANQQQL